ncbi:MAG TPA: hypothetical protein VK017_01580 [Sphingobacterium sp.]|jgi:hypothetical protein|nr:hypothetical protein [Sphingobacterium sp.]
MTFQYSICAPPEKEIQIVSGTFSGKEVVSIARNYPWVERLRMLDSLNEEDIHFAPSLDFKNIENNKSFCLTAHFDDNRNLEFSLWYQRPQRVKPFLGLFGKKEKMVVDDVWAFTLEDALKYLQHFVEGEFEIIESLYT